MLALQYIKYGAESKDPPNMPEGEVLPAALVMQMNANSGSTAWENNLGSSNAAKTTITTTTTSMVSSSQPMVTSSSKVNSKVIHFPSNTVF